MEKIDRWIHVSEDDYDKIFDLLQAHTLYNNSEGEYLRAIIANVSRILKMDIDMTWKDCLKDMKKKRSNEQRLRDCEKKTSLLECRKRPK